MAGWMACCLDQLIPQRKAGSMLMASRTAEVLVPERADLRAERRAGLKARQLAPKTSLAH